LAIFPTDHVEKIQKTSGGNSHKCVESHGIIIRFPIMIDLYCPFVKFLRSAFGVGLYVNYPGIRAYVEAVKATVANDVVSISLDAVEQWSKWALSEADRIDPVKTARFLEEIEADDDAK
jgi:hypothetical protein